MKKYIVYMHISPSGKRYIGITCKKKPECRWRNGKGYETQQYFYKAINKYGWDNFQHIIIARGLSEDEAKWLEIELIKEWDTTDKSKGYNITLGGEGTRGWIPSEETRKKISEKMKGENNPMYNKNFSEEHRRRLSEASKGENHRMYGKHHTEETRKKISEANEGRKHTEEAKRKMSIAQKGKQFSEETRKKIGEAHKGKTISEEQKKKISETHKGKTISEEHKRRISEKLKGKNSPSAKPVICITTGKIFFLAKEGAEYYKCNNTHISSCCSGKRKSCGKLSDGTPLVWMYLEEFLDKCKYIIL